MAVSSYASLVSLTHVLNNLHYRAQFQLPRADLKQVELLQGNVHFLLEFVERYSERKSPAMQGLWKQMAEVAFEAEDTINFHVVNQLHMRSQEETTDGGFLAFCEDMQALIQKFSYIKEKLPVIKEEGEDAKPLKRPNVFAPIGGSSSASSKVKIGIDEDAAKIMDELTRGESNLQVFPITGMGGIGKTTLARTVFYLPYIVEYFDLRIWLTISQDYTIEQILMGLLEEGNRGASESVVKSGETLYKNLFGRKFLIVMDDVWTVQAWDDLRKFFPNNGNGSRIILTTRCFNVGAHLGSHNPYKLNFLDEDKSWDLFCANVFAQIGCPYPNLEKIGKDIVKCCRGLPLEIVVIGQLLANSNMDQEYWEFVAENIKSLHNLEDYQHCLKVLSLSYESLPIHLKPCFLFMRTFPEDSRIEVSDLMAKWIAQGFIKQLGDKSLEETTDEYAKALFDRNLIFKRSENECGIHDLLRDLCFRESNNEHFLRSPKVQQHARLYHEAEIICFLCNAPVKDKTVVQFPHSVHICASSPELSAFVCDSCKMLYSHITRPIIVKTMDINSKFEIMQPTELRYYLANFRCAVKWAYPPTLHLLWNLQLLAINTNAEIVLPPEIWMMPQLMHVIVPHGFQLAHPIATEEGDFVVLKSLQTLGVLLNFKFTRDVLDRISNLKNLEIRYDMELSNYFVCDLAPLRKLESLGIDGGPLKNIIFPSSLKVLWLINYRMTEVDMSILGSLQRLETLHLSDSIKESEWNPTEGEFLQLKQLHIENSELKRWRADSIHFPVLERLELNNMHSLEEIPLGIGDIPTLQSIELKRCTESVLNSAKRIWEEQQSFGNVSLQIHVTDCRAREMSYQMDSVHATLTATASRSWINLKEFLELLERVCWINLNTKQRETVEEHIQFLREFVEVGYQTKTQEMETLSEEIQVLDMFGSLPYAPSDLEDLKEVMQRIAFIKDSLSVDKF